MDGLPDELLVRILSLLFSSRHLYSCSLVSKRWAHLVRLVTHFSLESTSAAAEEQGLVRWFGSSNTGTNLRSLSFSAAPSPKRCCSLGWLEGIGKNLHSLSIGSYTRFVDGFWSSIAACQKLRCLHIDAMLDPLPAEAAPPILPNLRLCFLEGGVDVFTLQQLLAHWKSLVHLKLNNVVVKSPGTYLLESQSLDSLFLRTRKSVHVNFSIALDMPKLRCMFCNAVPRVELLPSTCNVEWIKLHGDVRDIQGLRLSKLKMLTIGSTFASSAHLTQRLEPIVSRKSSLGGIRELHLLLSPAVLPHPRSVNLAALLEPFHGLEVLEVARRAIKLLSLEEWSDRHAPLRVRIFSPYSTEVDVESAWNSDEVEFVWGLMGSSSCVTLLEIQSLAGCRVPEERRPRIPGAIQEVADAFPGRVKLHPFRYQVPRMCGQLWHLIKAGVYSEALHTESDHPCKCVDVVTMCA
ncbi:uncharacterized protein LOC112347379 [Selaginella moellendorffii]|uniref:uncharacterized protein LOC112347379 n=1 Tax=Selaginella moellendorffii TaxID=88036 RepID=UPI000D1C2A44|nr:uncharacterized protein LOC112347379 [Selaginella moellendorffii]|eukprot:XP_024533882.1 uncharacterized protein LOC112347379 [Selaginella moellendorffii]